MHLLQRLAPRRPVVPRHQARIDPFGQIGQQRQRLADQRRQSILCQAFRQGVYCLAQLSKCYSAIFCHMVGVDDLQQRAKLVEPAGDPALLA